jgi:hypothetical protein
MVKISKSYRIAAWISVLLIFMACAQFEDIQKIDLKGLTRIFPDPHEYLKKITGGLVKTQINDAYPIATWLDGLDESLVPKESSSFDLAPGYYRMRIQSYCLKAGSYTPAPEEGHLMAPMLGSKTELIQGILQRSAQHPEIPQQDIQRLLWSIESGVSFSDLPSEMQLRVRPLLESDEIRKMSIDWVKIAKLAAIHTFPEETTRILDLYEEMREKLLYVNVSLQVIEQIALLTGKAPIGPGSRTISPRRWTYVADGFYASTVPENYSTSVIEVLHPAPYRLKRDGKGRIVSFESGNYRIETTYDDRPGRNIIRLPDGSHGKIWRFKSIKFLGKHKTAGLILRNTGWIIASDDEVIARHAELEDLPKGMLAFSSGAVSDESKIILADARSHSQHIAKKYPDRPTIKKWYERGEQVKKTWDKVKTYREEYKRSMRPPDEQAIRDLIDLKHYRDGIKSAVKPEDIDGRAEWVSKHSIRVLKAWEYANYRLAQLELASASGSFCPISKQLGRRKY